MTEILVNFCNIIINKGYYLERWLNIVDIMHKIGKGPRLEKLRRITSIESDLQILMRIFLDAKDNELIENSNMFLKVNHRSRKITQLK